MKEYIIVIGDEPDIMGNYGLKETPKEIVRCKDCKFHHASKKLNLCWCEKDFVEGLHSREWFCADGERK